MRLRYWVLVLADVMVVMHIIFLVLLVVDKYHDEDTFTGLFSPKVPAAVNILSNVMPMVLSSFLYSGIFRLSSKLLFMWLTAMVFIWHIPAILIFYILCLDRDVHARKLTIVAPILWLCVWILLIINVFTFYSELKKFKKNPRFLRINVVLVKKMNHLSKLKAGHPGKLLVAVPSDV